MVPVVLPESRFSPSNFNFTLTNPVVSILVELSPNFNFPLRIRWKIQFGIFLRVRLFFSPNLLLPQFVTLTLEPTTKKTLQQKTRANKNPSLPPTMAGTNGSLLQTHIPNQTLDRLFTALDPKSLILSQFGSDQGKPSFLQLTTESFMMERGPRYKAYCDLRESKLRLKKLANQSPEQEPNLSPPKKQVKFQGSFPRKGSSVLAQSVPDFSAVVRKENRKPPAGMLPPVMEKSLTPPAKSSKMYGVGARSGGGGSKSVNSGEKRSGGIIMGRKSYACMEELKGFSAAAANAINGENRGGRNGRGGVGKTVLGYRQY